MKTKHLALVFLILALLTAGIYFYQRGDSSSMDKASFDRTFKVENVDAVQKIFLADRKTGNETTLTRNGDHWIYNGKYKANANVMKNLLRAIGEIEIKYLPTKAAQENIKKELLGNAIKVEIYGKGDQLLNSYYIGSGTNDNYGSFAIREGSNVPQVVHLPSILGLPLASYDKQPREWRSRAFIEENPEQIKSVRIDYPRDQKRSFYLSRQDDQIQIEPIYPGVKKPAGAPFDRLITNYFEGFERLVCEGYEEAGSLVDSLHQVGDYTVHLELIRANDSKLDLKLYAMPLFDKSDNFIRTDNLRYLGVVNNGEERVLVQKSLLAPVLRSYEFFFREQQ